MKSLRLTNVVLSSVGFAAGLVWLLGATAAGSDHFARIHFLPPSPGASPTPVPQLTVSQNQPFAEQPYWRHKPDLIKQMRDDRKITVSVNKKDLPSGRVQFSIAAAGVVKATREKCFPAAQDYGRLKTVSEHFKTAEFNANYHQLFLVTEALGYQARMILEILPVRASWRDELQFKILGGHFTGMSGAFGFESISERETEVSILAEFEGSEFPLPKVLMGFALEVIVQKVAEKMRTTIESSAKASISASGAAVRARASSNFSVTDLHDARHFAKIIGSAPARW